VIVAVLHALGAVSSLVGFHLVRLLLSAAGAWAFSANLRASIGRTQRMLAIVVQVVNLLAVLGLIVVAMLVAANEGRGWEDVPAWLWLVIAITLTIPAVAIVDGIRAYLDEP